MRCWLLPQPPVVTPPPPTRLLLQLRVASQLATTVRERLIQETRMKTTDFLLYFTASSSAPAAVPNSEPMERVETRILFYIEDLD